MTSTQQGIKNLFCKNQTCCSEKNKGADKPHNLTNRFHSFSEKGLQNKQLKQTEHIVWIKSKVHAKGYPHTETVNEYYAQYGTCAKRRACKNVMHIAQQTR